MTVSEISRAMEAILFVTGESVALKDLAAALEVSDLELTQGYRLSIGVQSPEGYLKQEDGDGLIPYSLEDDLGLFDERFFDEMQDVALRLHVSREAWRSAPAGAYSGRLTFSVIPKYTAEEENG